MFPDSETEFNKTGALEGERVALPKVTSSGKIGEPELDWIGF